MASCGLCSASAAERLERLRDYETERVTVHRIGTYSLKSYDLTFTISQHTSRDCVELSFDLPLKKDRRSARSRHGAWASFRQLASAARAFYSCNCTLVNFQSLAERPTNDRDGALSRHLSSLLNLLSNFPVESPATLLCRNVVPSTSRPRSREKTS